MKSKEYHISFGICNTWTQAYRAHYRSMTKAKRTQNSNSSVASGHHHSSYSLHLQKPRVRDHILILTSPTCQVSKANSNHLLRKPGELSPSLRFFYLQVAKLHNFVNMYDTNNSAFLLAVRMLYAPNNAL